MLSQGNKNLIVTYGIAILVCGGLVFVMMNFNKWFFPDKKLQLNTFTPSSRGTITQQDLNFGIFTDKKFISLQPILTPGEITNEEGTPSGEGGETSGTITPKVKPAIELRHANPFQPF